MWHLQLQLCLTSVLRSVPVMGCGFLIRCHLSKTLRQKQETQWLTEGMSRRSWLKLCSLADLTQEISVSVFITSE